MPTSNPADRARAQPVITARRTVSRSNARRWPYFTGAIKTATGSFTYALLAIAVIMVAGLVVLVTVGRRVERLDGKLTS